MACSKAAFAWLQPTAIASPHGVLNLANEVLACNEISPLTLSHAYVCAASTAPVLWFISSLYILASQAAGMVLDLPSSGFSVSS